MLDFCIQCTAVCILTHATASYTDGTVYSWSTAVKSTRLDSSYGKNPSPPGCNFPGLSPLAAKVVSAHSHSQWCLEMPSARIDPDAYASENADKFIGMARILSKKYPKEKINSKTLAGYAGHLLLVRRITC